MVNSYSTDYLSNLGDALSQQFGLGDNKVRSLDIVKDGAVQRYGALGEFANKFDRTAERSYVEKGFFKQGYYDTYPNQLEVLMQEPDVTVLIKKRAFSSLAENFRIDFMDIEERLFYKTTKILFQNKCKQISAFEKLTKIEKIASDMGSVDYHLLPIIYSLVDTLNDGLLGGGAAQAVTKLKSVMDKIKEVITLSDSSIYTSWITNVLDVAKTEFGEGTGVIELTTVSGINTTTSTTFGGGSFSLNIVDPYELMLITNADIEKAINDATNTIINNSFVQFGQKSLDELISMNKLQLNQIRAARGANEISFLINEEAFLGKKITALIDAIGFEIQFDANALTDLGGSNLKQSIKIDPSALLSSTDPQNIGNDRLKPDEVGIFSAIVSSIYSQLTLLQNSRTNARNFNINVNNVRKKLRLHYGNKLLIQPMDVVHIYINSKTKVDTKILGGLQSSFGQSGFLQDANAAVTGLKDFFNVDGESTIEKAIFVGSDFPNWLWSMLRNQFISDKTGTHVFAGVTETSSSEYSNGAFRVSVAGKDNTAYFDYGVVNFKPSLDVFNGPLFDPLTPFDLQFDSATGLEPNTPPQLLTENKELFSSAFLKYKNGQYAGVKPTEANLVQDTERTINNKVRKVFYDPDGFVYRWKEGIGSVVQFGDSSSDTPLQNQSAPAITADPFAGQDVMNVYSLLITGQPYNFATFYKAASEFNGFGRDPLTGKDPSVSYFKNLQTDLKYNNLVYGNFIPFKTLSVDEESYKNIITNQMRAISADSTLNDLLTQRAVWSDRLLANSALNKSGSEPIATDTNNGSVQSNIIEQISKLDIQIAASQKSIAESLSKTNKTLTIVGDDISFNSNISSGIGVDDKNRIDTGSRKELRKRVNFLTRRMAWKVRANDDVNLFIVDDSYDKDYDIQGFEKSLGEMKNFESDYIKVSDKIRQLSTILKLEVFANTQGHIEVRAPQYNKMPSSIFYKMMQMKNELGIQVYPQFLEDLFLNQLDTALQQIEIIEDEMRLLCIAIGKVGNSADESDSIAEAFIKSPSSQTVAGTTNNFRFLSKGAYARIVSQDLKPLIIQSNPDQIADTTKLESINTVFNDLSQIDAQSQLTNVFNVTSRSQFITSNLTVSSKSFTIGSTNFQTLSNIKNTSIADSLITTITARLQTKTGVSFDLDQFFTNSKKNPGLNDAGKVSAVDQLQILSNIATRLTTRQQLLKNAANALKNIKEGLKLNDPHNHTQNKMIAPNLFGSNAIPEAFRNMIEDESFNDYGDDSGKRFVIQNKNIMSYSIQENRPDYTSISVTGNISDNFQIDIDPGLDIGFGGNALASAQAIDYDMWRMYGLSIPQNIEARYLTNPETQVAQFAVALLTEARKNIFRGSIDIVGNEYMQPGEVVYLEPRELLFYVESVRHSFTFGGSFTTSLQVAYGHNPGEYIPTYLDVIGKVLFRNKELHNYVNKRQGSVFNQDHLGTIIGAVSAPTSGTFNGGSADYNSDMLDSTFGLANSAALKNILKAGALSLSNVGSDYIPKLELRIFRDTTQGSRITQVSKYASGLAGAIKDFLVGNSSVDSTNTNNTYGLNKPSNNLKEFESSIIILDIDSNKDAKSSSNGQTSDFRSPSHMAYSLAKTALKIHSNTDAVDKSTDIDTTIHHYIVDCWIVYQNANTTNTKKTT